MADVLGDLGHPRALPGGGFYLWVPAPGGDAWALARRLAAELGVVGSPGEFYGDAATGHVRLAMVQPDAALAMVAGRAHGSGDAWPRIRAGGPSDGDGPAARGGPMANSQTKPKGALVAALVFFLLGIAGCGFAAVSAVPFISDLADFVSDLDEFVSNTPMGEQASFTAGGEDGLVLLSDEAACTGEGPDGAVRFEAYEGFGTGTNVELNGTSMSGYILFETRSGADYSITCGSAGTGSFLVTSAPTFLVEGALGAAGRPPGLPGRGLLRVPVHRAADRGARAAEPLEQAARRPAGLRPAGAAHLRPGPGATAPRRGVRMGLGARRRGTGAPAPAHLGHTGRTVPAAPCTRPDTPAAASAHLGHPGESRRPRPPAPARSEVGRPPGPPARGPRTGGHPVKGTDLLALAAELVAVPSESFGEAELAGRIEARLGALGHLHTERVGDNVVARTELGRPGRVVLGGHTDTVPANGNASARIEGDVLWGVGSGGHEGRPGGDAGPGRALAPSPPWT